MLRGSYEDTAAVQWPTRLHACVHASGAHSQHTLWLYRFFSLYFMNFMFHTTLDTVIAYSKRALLCKMCFIFTR